MADENKELAKRVEALEALTGQLAASVEALEALEALTGQLAASVEALEALTGQLAKRVEALEALTGQLAASVEALEASKPAAAPKPLDQKDPLHPSKVGTSAYNELRGKLLKVLPHEKEYAAAQAQLRAAGII